MYYIIRYGTDMVPLKQIELSYSDKSRKRWEFFNNYLARALEDGYIRKYTCILITRGERVNEAEEK